MRRYHYRYPTPGAGSAELGAAVESGHDAAVRWKVRYCSFDMGFVLLRSAEVVAREGSLGGDACG